MNNDGKPDDTDLERYLAGEHPVSAHYRDTADAEPPPELDKAIRQQACHSARKRPHRWRRRMAAAAVLMLGVGMVFELQHYTVTPTAQQSQQTATVSSHASRAEDALRLGVTSAPKHGAPEQKTAASTMQPFAAVTSKIPGAADANSQTIEQQIAHIQHLLDTGKPEAARAGLRQLLKQHPGVQLPPELRQLADNPAGTLR